MDGLQNLIDAVDTKIDELEGATSDIMNSKKITASDVIETEADLRNALEEVLDSDLATQIIDLAISEDGTFEDKQFMPRDDFFDSVLANDSPKEIAEVFFYGKDLDSNKDFADPTKDFLRFNDKDYIESTDYPGDIYLYNDNLIDAIIGYILDNMENLEFPDYIQELIDEYLEKREG